MSRFRYVKIWLILFVLFELLMIAAYSIPDKWVRNNVVTSADTIKKQGLYPVLVAGDNRTQKDNWTEAYILNMCIHAHSDSNFITNAIINPYYDTGNDRIYDLIDGIDKQANTSYGRYWQGQLTIIRPLLLLFNLEQIYIVFEVVFVLALLFCLYRIYRTTSIYYSLTLLLSFIMIKPHIICFSTKLYFSFLISLIFTIVITYQKDDSFNTDRIRKMFFIAAAITVYTDFFSTPPVTLGLPLTTLIIKERHTINKYDYKELFTSFIRIVLAWIAGYVVFGISNWIIYILLSNNHQLALEGIISRFLMWIGLREYAGEQYDTLIGIRKIFLVFAQSRLLAYTYLFVYIISFITIFLLSYKNNRHNLLLLGIGVLPYFWWLIASTSVFAHAWHVFRTMIIIIYTILCAVVSLIKDRDITL